MLLQLKIELKLNWIAYCLYFPLLINFKMFLQLKITVKFFRMVYCSYFPLIRNCLFLRILDSRFLRLFNHSQELLAQALPKLVISLALWMKTIILINSKEGFRIGHKRRWCCFDLRAFTVGLEGKMTVKFQWPPGQLIQFTNRHSEFSSFSHKSGAFKYQYKRTFTQRFARYSDTYAIFIK